MKNRIKELLENGEYALADQLLGKNISLEQYNDEIAVFDAVIGLHFQDIKRVWNACANGLTMNPGNYELYVILGEYYFYQNNYDQMYLCYENALYYCRDEIDREQIIGTIKMIRENYSIGVKNVSIIILSL